MGSGWKMGVKWSMYFVIIERLLSLSGKFMVLNFEKAAEEIMGRKQSIL